MAETISASVTDLLNMTTPNLNSSISFSPYQTTHIPNGYAASYPQSKSTFSIFIKTLHRPQNEDLIGNGFCFCFSGGLIAESCQFKNDKVGAKGWKTWKFARKANVGCYVAPSKHWEEAVGSGKADLKKFGQEVWGKKRCKRKVGL